MQKLILLQGPPGSGKSSRAPQLAAAHPPAKVCSTDAFHAADGVYRFDRENVAYYHAWNQWEAYHWLLDGWNVIVDNTNLKRAHVQPYLDMARLLGVFVQVVRCTGEYANGHGVPAEVVARMRAEMEDLLEKGA